MSQQHSKDGSVPFEAPGISKPCSTYYKIIGDLSSDNAPIVMLHGGPGGGHEYLLTFAELWTHYSIPVVLYDQLGCGASTHLPETAGDGSFWNEALFIAELNNLLDHLRIRDGPGFHLYGHSWGASHKTCVEDVKLLRGQLTAEQQAILDKAEQNALGGNYDNWASPAVKEISALMGSKHVCRASSVPPELVPAFKNLTEDTTVYQTMWGRNWLIPYGTLSGWTVVPRFSKITAPTLVYNGEFDTSHDVTTVPFFELIPRVRWVTLAGAGHMSHVEDDAMREKVLSTVGDFLIQDKGLEAQD